MGCFASEIKAVFVIYFLILLQWGRYVKTRKTEVSVDAQLIGSKHLGVRMVRLISLLNDGLLPVCASLFPSTARFWTKQLYSDISSVVVRFYRNRKLETKKQQQKKSCNGYRFVNFLGGFSLSRTFRSLRQFQAFYRLCVLCTHLKQIQIVWQYNLYPPRKTVESLRPLLAHWKPHEPEWQLSPAGTLFAEGNTALPKFLRCSSCICIICYGIWNMRLSLKTAS